MLALLLPTWAFGTLPVVADSAAGSDIVWID